ncbi:MAG: DNA/RNA nuclease SfsA [Chloroflexi bacterium]|nr:DNA/RNA nuclease SfsA [Chloroflexota bacterium]
MELPNGLVLARFVRRLNRFAALVQLDDRQALAHVPNSGRLRELLRPGRPVYLAPQQTPGRRTAYDMVLVQLPHTLVCMDARLPSALFCEAVREGALAEFQGYSRIVPEVRYGDSRIDLLLEGLGDMAPSAGSPVDRLRVSGGYSSLMVRQAAHERAPSGGARQALVETKSITLVRRGTALFPDAPTSRGARHLRTLMQARREGLRAAVCFVVQREDARRFRPYDAADTLFGATLREAAACGVEVHAYRCRVTPETARIVGRVPVLL